MILSEIVDYFDKIYPKELSCSWDNDGLMVCQNIKKDITRVAVALDANIYSVDFSIKNGCELLLSHHPYIFDHIGNIRPSSLYGDRVIYAFRNDISVISLHTRLDAAKNGVSETLAKKIGAKLIGNISSSNDEPPYGRIGEFDDAVSEINMINLLKERLGAPVVEYCCKNPIKRMAICGGAGKDLICAALENKCDTLVTGEVGYNSVIDACEQGLNIFAAGHYYTEYPICDELCQVCKDILHLDVFKFDNTLEKIG